MAKVASGKKPTGRRSTVIAKSEVGNTREDFLKGLVALSMTNEEIWGAMERRFPQIIEDNRERRVACEKRGLTPVPEYDAEERERVGWAIRSVKGLAVKLDENLSGIEAKDNQAGAVSADKFENLERWSCGWPVLDFIFGETQFVHCIDHPASRYEMVEKTVINEAGGKERKKVRVWKSGPWQMGDPLCYDVHQKALAVRDKDGQLLPNLSELRKATQKVEVGLPYGYMGFVGGQPGVGKSRTAIDLCHSITKMDEVVLYVNGEAAPAQFRSWCGARVSDLFRVIHGDHKLVPFRAIEEQIIKYKPRLVVIDSAQTITEWNKGLAGQKRVLNLLGMIKSDPSLGKPHILMISQLNKKLDLAGAKILEHLVDYSIKAFRREGHKHQFFLESAKMRGAECPRGALFKHLAEGVVCLSTEFGNKPVYDLQTAPVPQAVMNGVPTAPPVMVTGDASDGVAAA